MFSRDPLVHDMVSDCCFLAFVCTGCCVVAASGYLYTDVFNDMPGMTRSAARLFRNICGPVAAISGLLTWQLR